MATQTFNLQWNDIPAGKPILSKSEIIDYCRHFGQATQELQDFLTRFDFDEWICMELFVDYVYGKTDKKGQVGSDAVQYLSLIATTFFSDEGELALQKYLGFGKNGFDYPREGDVSFVTFEDCPLWMVQITGKKKQYSSGIFFMPAVFWKDANMTGESYAYEKYTVKYSKWYRDPFGKSRLQNEYWLNRIGGYSPNFIDRESGAVIDFEKHHVYFDKWEGRLLFLDNKNQAIVYYRLSEPQKRIELKEIAPVTYDSFIITTQGAYAVYLENQLLITDKSFEKINEAPTKIVNYFEDDYWKVILDNKGVLMTKKQSNEEKRFRYSELKISAYSNNPKWLSIGVNSNQSVIFFGLNLSIVDSSFNVTNIDLGKVFKKEIPLYLNSIMQNKAMTILSPDRQLLFSGNGVFELGKDEVPKIIQNKLTAITGEGVFYNAVKDDALQGIWFIAGNDRLVFTDGHFEIGYVFNFSEQISDPRFNMYRHCNMFLDHEQNLWYSLLNGKLHKINRKELETRLKKAIPYSNSTL
ncbi:hypothetical protein [Chryseobacterium sp. 2987]|uniref:hypothetical protein n=1 Tax=Chryseobacterium sp. 2987 TaxID=2817767 RepID=UPI00285A7DE9|nr:hypothetical protein [Chryseobacterium sp. 2987]MDR6919804.1 hypothetical protein [Chryseobacterium sp. 2987]